MKYPYIQVHTRLCTLEYAEGLHVLPACSELKLAKANLRAASL